MPIDIIDTTTNQIHVLDDGTTLADIIYALNYIERERARHRVNNKMRVRKPTGKPPGRPRKNPPASEIDKIDSDPASEINKIDSE